MIFGFDFNARKNKALSLFSRAIEELDALSRDAAYEEQRLKEDAAELHERAQDLEYEARQLQEQQAETELVREKLKDLIAA